MEKTIDMKIHCRVIKFYKTLTHKLNVRQRAPLKTLIPNIEERLSNHAKQKALVSGQAIVEHCLVVKKEMLKNAAFNLSRFKKHHLSYHP